jgi:hypothetical protein
MKVSINQPAFFPWLGYFHRIAISDLHIVLDHVQFEKNSFTNRNKIKTPDGTIWLTVPVNTSGKFGDLAIHKIEIANQIKWQKKITETIRQFYKKAPFFEQYFPFIEDTLLNHEWTAFSKLLRYLNNYFLKELDIHTPLVYSSEIDIEGTKSDLVLNLCKQYNTDTYISGPFGKDYLEHKKFEDTGIDIEYHEYSHPEYSQQYGDFTPYLSVIDLLFNCGNESKKILMLER